MAGLTSCGVRAPQEQIPPRMIPAARSHETVLDHKALWGDHFCRNPTDSGLEGEEGTIKQTCTVTCSKCCHRAGQWQGPCAEMRRPYLQQAQGESSSAALLP